MAEHPVFTNSLVGQTPKQLKGIIMHHWSDKELLRYYEERLEEGVVKKKGSTYSRMMEVKERLEKKRRERTIERMRKANRLIISKNGKSSK